MHRQIIFTTKFLSVPPTQAKNCQIIYKWKKFHWNRHFSIFVLSYAALVMSENLEKQCLNCKTFVKKHNFSRHLQRCVKNYVVCPICNEHQDDLSSHIKKCGVKKYTCRCCTAEFSTGRSRCEHEKRCRRSENSKFTPDKTSCNGGFQIYVLKPEIDSIDYEAERLQN